jgi:hypothetical protein
VLSEVLAESIVDLQALNHQLSERLVAFAWDQWAQMGVLAAARGHSRWAQDPEALIVFTLKIARDEPRLFDELLDWMPVNEALLSVRRLCAMCIDDTDRAFLYATIASLGCQRPRPRLGGGEAAPAPELLHQLFRPPGPSGETDVSFAAVGFAWAPLTPSHKSRSPESSAPINLAFRLRQIFGVGSRVGAELPPKRPVRARASLAVRITHRPPDRSVLQTLRVDHSQSVAPSSPRSPRPRAFSPGDRKAASPPPRP